MLLSEYPDPSKPDPKSRYFNCDVGQYGADWIRPKSPAGHSTGTPLSLVRRQRSGDPDFNLSEQDAPDLTWHNQPGELYEVAVIMAIAGCRCDETMWGRY